ncbi:hypothetical protein TCAL_07707 [Tigriopus californicus]|uniref:RNA-binding protein 42 n=1 Tax=Tigriopus californicus TaxID=6832 RepID=A0A553NCB7_TIGCA|nr:RNA-binding protein 42-like [Tigriopus californicus]TRY63067.1 hypothetical protein TCAL_07707 [Tigriopus californicus]|eukprot:TCALIF_07707-PA protein Name:"Similar to rbm42 RNA-binding protein 42 (Xenopus laevis)" AED:0.01 eAED:0.08 QI:0/-1/0/1/-1/1/1/0/330
MNFEEEMSRFEAEIHRGAANAMGPMGMGLHFHAPRPPMSAPMFDPAFLPHAIHARAGLPPPSAQMQTFAPTAPAISASPVVKSAAPVITAPPQTRTAAKSNDPAANDDDLDILAKLEKYEKEMGKDGGTSKKSKKKKEKSSTNFTPSVIQKPVPASSIVPSEPPPATQSSNVSAPLPVPLSKPGFPPPPNGTTGEGESGKKVKKPKRLIRSGGGQVWEDSSLKEWDQNDYRIFCGDLGNDVTDEVLARTFGRYPSFQRAKVVRDKRTNKTKGYGFVSFKDPMDFTKAMREMNGKYVGSRPIKLRKSNWRDRNIDVVKQKQKLKQQMGYKW